MKNILMIVGLMLWCLTTALAQQVPAAPQNQPVLITGGTAHLGNGKIIENSIIGFEEGKLTIVGDATTVRPDGSENWEQIDATGKDIYPGLIATNTQIGLIEIGAVRATRDASEVGSLNPNLRAIIAYNTDSKVTPTVRSNGILIAQVVPQGGLISGTSSIVELDGWNWEDAVYKMDNGVHLNWPSMMTWTGWQEGNPRRIKNKKYDKQVMEIQQFIGEAKAYCGNGSRGETNLKLAAMCNLFTDKAKMFIHVNDAEGITTAIPFKSEFGIEIVIIGGRDSYRVATLLAKEKIPVILHQTQSMPYRNDDDIDQPFKTPKALQDAGVLYAIGGEGYWQQRNLPFQAGQAVGFGLPREMAIQAITRNPAIILGIDKTVGTLEKGKDATLIISSGDVLDMRTSNIERAFIQGKSIDLDDKQKALYRKFKEKYSR